jgi:hypothetical protein
MASEKETSFYKMDGRMKKKAAKKLNTTVKEENCSVGLRLPLDLLLVHDVDDLEEALTAKWAVEHEQEIFFCQTDDDLDDLVQDFDVYTYYQLDEIENDRIKAIIDLLNRAEEDNILSHILDRIVR